MQGATIIEGVRRHRRAHSSAARSPACARAHGDIEAEYVVNCAGMWARQLGEQAGVNIPLQAAEHYYLITEPIPGLPRDAAGARGPGLVRLLPRGGRRPDDRPVRARLRAVEVDGIPEDFSFGEIPPDWDRMAPYVEKAMRARADLARDRHDASSSAARRASRPTCARSSARRPSCKNYFVAAGLNSIGILTGGGLGRVLAHWIVNGRPDVDVTGFNIDRLHRYQAQPRVPARRARSSRSAWSTSATTRRARCRPRAARSARRSTTGSPRAAPTSATSAAGRAPTGTRRPGVEPKVEQLSWGRQNWFPYWEAEHRAAREGVILMDMSFMSKFLVQGRDAGRVLEPHLRQRRRRRGRARSPTRSGSTRRGTLEADLTVTKLDDERFWVVATDTAHRHVETWMRRHIARRRARLRHRRDVRPTRSSTSRARARASCCSR